MYLFLATELIEGNAEPEDDEYIEIEKIKLEDLIEMILKGEIVDSKTIIGIYYGERYISQK